MKIDNRSIWSLLALVVIAVLIVISTMNDSRDRINAAEEMMISQGGAIADIMAESSIRGITAYNNWEKEVTRRLTNNARWLVRFDSLHGLDEETITTMAKEFGLNRVHLFDHRGQREMSNPSLERPAGPSDGGVDIDLPRGFLEPLISGLKESSSLGFRKSPRTGQRNFVVGVARPGGGAIVVNVRAEDMTKVLKGVGPGHLIKALAGSQGIEFVVLQDENGIQASSTTQPDFLTPRDELALAPLLDGEPYITRQFTSTTGDIFEVSKIITQANGKLVLLRVGLDGSLLGQLKQDTRRRAVFRGAIFLLAMALVVFLLLAWQKEAVLGQAVKKIERELRAKEEEARRAGKLVAMGSLAAGVAHQIRNPLNSIHMIAQMIKRRTDVPDDLGRQMGHIRDESGRIEKIVQQFLDFAKPRDPVLEPLRLDLLVTEIMDIQTSAFENVNLEFRVETVPVTLPLDRSFMIQILENLIRNAAEACRLKGIIEVKVEMESKAILVTVADNGPGVAPTYREKIFDLYFTTHDKGSGLGLGLTNQMVTAMGGHLELADSAGLEGKGALFVVNIPKPRSQS